MFAEDGTTQLNVESDDLYMGIGIVGMPNELGFMVFYGTVYTIDCKYEETSR